MAKKKGMNFLNFIGLGSSEEPVAQEDMDYEEETPVNRSRRSRITATITDMKKIIASPRLRPPRPTARPPRSSTILRSPRATAR